MALVCLNLRGRLRFSSRFVRTFGIGLPQLSLWRSYLGAALLSCDDAARALPSAMEWLCRAHDACGGRGVSAAFYLGRGWDGPYPEVSGYLIPSFLAYADLTGDGAYAERACRIADWEVEVQAPNGGVRSGFESKEVRVFNTGQVILGWLSMYARLRENAYLEAASRAGDYLLRNQEKDGSWQNDTYCGARTYHSRCAWALLELARCTGRGSYRLGAARSIEWVLRQRMSNGWFRRCGFHNDPPITHVIEYTLRGLLECYASGLERARELDLLSLVRISTERLLDSARSAWIRGIVGLLPGAFDGEWRAAVSYSCLTGNAQLAVLCYRLAQLTGEQRFADEAELLAGALLAVQYRGAGFDVIRGALPGSFPLYAGYVAAGFPSWATKFLADMLMMKRSYQSGFYVTA